MTWFEQSANATEAAKPHVHFFVAVDFDFPSGHARFWTGVGTLNFGGFDYSGAGPLGHIGTPPDNDRLVAERKTYQLSGVDPSVMAESDIDNCFGRQVTEYFGFLTEQGALVAAPEVNWQGNIDAVQRRDGKECYIEVNAEYKLVLLDRSDGTMYTDEHQQLLFPGDLGFDKVQAIATKKILWGDKYVYKPGQTPTVPRGYPRR